MTRFLVICLALLLVFTPASFGEVKPLKPTNKWSGSVADENLAKDAPTCIVSAKGLEKLWKAWKIADKMPEVRRTS